MRRSSIELMSGKLLTIERVNFYAQRVVVHA